MTYKTAAKINDTFTLDADFNIRYGKNLMDDPMSKGYIYANLYFYDETEKEIAKLRSLVEKIHKEVCMELGIEPNDTPKLLLEISTRANRTIGDDGLDCIIKEFLAQKSNHICLMIDAHEKFKYIQICETIFAELTTGFYNTTLQTATDLERGVKTFKFTREYLNAMSPRQKFLCAPALRVIGLENQVKINNLIIAQDWTVKYSPELAPTSFQKQEETIKDQIKSFIQSCVE